MADLLFFHLNTNCCEYALFGIPLAFILLPVEDRIPDMERGSGSFILVERVDPFCGGYCQLMEMPGALLLCMSHLFAMK